jgi:MEMO1 family protein
MSIVFSAIVPHPLILVPQIGKENIVQLKNTQDAFNKLKTSLLESLADTIILISPHGTIHSTAFAMNLCPEFSCNFEEFGDFSTREKWSGNVGLAHRIKEAVETKAPLQLISQSTLDYGSTVPLLMLLETSRKMKVIPLYYSGLENEAHFKFGQLLKKELIKSKERIAVISSGDLSHRLDKKAPGGYSPKAKRFDTKITKCLLEKKTQSIIEIDKDLIMEVGECGLKSILLLLGILDEVNYKPKLLSYEHPFGVGYLTMEMELL